MSIAASTQALARLEPYLLLAKSAKNAAAAKLVAEATAAPGCFVFSELFDCDGIRALADDERYASSYRLLQLFAYGTVSDYVSSAPGTYPTLNVAQEEKLRHLTLISLASKRRTLSYSTLTLQLGLTTDSTDPSARTAASSAGPSRTIHARTMRRLEDVIIGAIYSGIVSARLDQLRQRVEVESVMGRDIVGTEQLAGLATALHDWQAKTSGMLTMLSQRIEDAGRHDAEKTLRRAKHDNEVEKVLLLLADGKGATSTTPGARAAYDRLGSDRYGGEMDIDDEAGVLRKKKSSSAGPVRSKRSRA